MKFKILLLSSIVFSCISIKAMLFYKEKEKDSLKLLSVLQNKGPVNSICYTPDGNNLLFGGLNNPTPTIKIYDTKDLSTIKAQLSSDRIIKKLACTEQMVSTANWNQLNIWDLTTSQNILKYDDQDDCATTVAYNKDGTLILAACVDGIGRIYDTRDKKCATQLCADAGQMKDAQWSPDNYQIATCSETNKKKNNLLNCWDIRTHRKLVYIEQPNENYLLQYHPTKNMIASAGSEKIVLYDTKFFTLLAAYWARGKKVDTLENENQGIKFPTVNSFMFSPKNHDMLIAGLDNASITFCDLQDPTQSICCDTDKSIETIATDPAAEYLSCGSFSSMDTTIYKLNIQMKDRAALMMPVAPSRLRCTLQ